MTTTATTATAATRGPLPTTDYSTLLPSPRSKSFGIVIHPGEISTKPRRTKDYGPGGDDDVSSKYLLFGAA